MAFPSDIEGNYKELFDLFCGAYLDDGATRKVYEYRLDPDKYVVKVEDDDKRDDWMQNIQEWLVWTGAHKDMKKFLAPCAFISKSGKFLIMRRAKPITPKQRPIRMPAFLYDIKDENLGIIDGRVVMVDYGLVAKYAVYNANRRLRKVRYHD
jgi:hypothetical protein